MAQRRRHSERLASLAQELESGGIQVNLCPVLAEGIVATIHRWCWRHYTDLLGTAEEVDAICPLPLPPCTLAHMLQRAEFAGLVKGRYFAPHAVTEVSENVRRRWQRKDKEGFRLARARAEAPDALTAEPDSPPTVAEPETLAIEPNVVAGQTDLFGNPLEPEKKKRRKPAHDKTTPGHKEVVAYWCEQWSAREGRGAAYPFRAQDAKFIKDLLTSSPSVDTAKRILDAYLGCREPFFAGKALKKLISDLPRFIAAANGGTSAAPGEVGYSGGDLPEL